jgi:AcrR family transcriptional regulator
MTTRRYEQGARAEAAEQTRRRILDAMYERLSEAPAEQVNIKDVAHRAGVVRSTVYAVFGSKAGLFDAFGNDVLRRGGFAALLAAAEHPDAGEAMRGTIRVGVRMYSSHREVLRALYSMARIAPDAVGGAVDRMEAGRARGMTEIAGRLSEQGILRSDVGVKEAADLLWVLTGFDTFDLLYTGRSRSLHRVTDTLIATADRSLCR